MNTINTPLEDVTLDGYPCDVPYRNRSDLTLRLLDGTRIPPKSAFYLRPELNAGALLRSRIIGPVPAKQQED